LIKKILSVLKVLLPLAFGVFLIWYVFKDLTEEEASELKQAFSDVNYFWISLALISGWLSHVSRAYRWGFMLNSMGYKPSVINNYHAVMISYVANMILPRAGEVSRCALMTKYESIPFNKAFGTVVAERAVDLIILLSVTIVTFFTQFSVLTSLPEINDWMANFSIKDNMSSLLVVVAVAALGILVFILIIKKFSHIGIVSKFKTFLMGLVEGLKTIYKMEKKGWYLFHTAFIWTMYMTTLLCCFFALDGTSMLPVGAILTAFVFGSFAITLVQGGIGAYPFVVMKGLMLYGVAKTTGLAAGWIVWTSQSVMLIVMGGLSLILISFYNKNRTPVAPQNHAEVLPE
jgi:glycosyltransferase 2 family protein